MQFLNKYRIPIAIAAAILIAIGLFWGYQAVIFFVSLGLTYLTVGSKLSRKIFTSAFYKFIVSLVIYGAVLQSVILFVWLFDHNFPLSDTIDLTAILLLIAFLWERFIGRQVFVSSKRLKLFDYSDVTALVVAILIVVLAIGAPVAKSLKNYGYVNVPVIAEDYINTNVDDASHLSRVNDRLQLNRGVIYKSDQAKNVVLQDTISVYPPGWHSANAVLIKSLDPSIKVGGQSLVAYVITKVFWLFVMVFCFVRVVFDLFRLFIKPKNRRQTIAYGIWLVGATSFLSYYLLIEQFKEGFYPFIPLITSLFLLIPLLLQLSLDKETPAKRSFIALLPLTLIVTNLTLSWFLILPAVVVALLIAFIHPVDRKNIRKLLLSIWNELVRVWPLVLVAVLAVIAQVLIITAPGSQTFKTGVDTPGSIAVPSGALFGFLIIGVILFYLLARQQAKILNNLTLLIAFLLGFAIFIFAFQIATIHGPQYYYYKTLYTVVLVALPLAIVGWLRLIEWASSDQPYLTAALFAGISAVGLPLAIGYQQPGDPSLASYVAGDRDFTNAENSYIYHSISSRGKMSLVQRNDSVIFYTPGDFGHNVIAANILRSIEPVNNCDNLVYNNLLSDNLPGLFSSIKNSCQSEPVTIVLLKQYYSEIKNLANSYDLGANVHFVSLD